MAILKEGLDHAAHHVVGVDVLARELLSRLGRRAVGSQPLLDLAPLVCQQGRAGPSVEGGRSSKQGSGEDQD